jgi:outer membrane protein OmpA-like peptidoglycan-associated protein
MIDNGKQVYKSKNYFMKKLFLLVLSGSIMTAICSQNIVKEHYTVSGGILGAANFTKFSTKGANASNIDYNTETGWSAGVWVNFPMTNRFSFEPQLMFSSYSYQADYTPPLLITDGELHYISLPLALKLHAGEKVAIIAGPQFDFFRSFEDDVTTNNVSEDDFKKTSISAFGGLEVFPHGRVTILGRYIHGFTNMNASDIHGNGVEYRNRNIQAGLKLKLFGKKVEADSDGDGIIDKNDKCPNEIGTAKYEGCPIPDTDKDGINDEMDKCPNEPGTAKYQGCPIPDTDKDGINDEEDKCPNQPGTAKYQGCPIPDTDGDGINDEEDKCPSQAGPASNGGCPITDRDNDGVSDEEDKCPDVAGTKENNGCPEIPADVSKLLSTSSQNISFGPNSAKLSTTANSSLTKVATVLNEHPEMKLRIEAHADNAEKSGDAISEQRANAVKTYLVSKGISADRIEVQGFGSAQPVADNNTTAGRTKNRRVELKIVY